MNREVSLQLYSISDCVANDLLGTLKKVAEMGYTGVEFAGIPSLPQDEVINKLKEVGLKVVSAHIGIEILEDDAEFEKAAAFLNAAGAKYITCPYTSFNSTETALEVAKRLNVCGAKCKEKGLQLAYHNHANEFEIDGGKYAIDTFFDAIDDSLCVQQPDIFWVAYAGADVMDYLAKHIDRIPMIHLKQIENLETKENVDAGDGILDFKKIMDMYPDVEFIYEQEHFAGEPIDSVEKSVKYILG